MDIELSSEDLAFKDEVRTFFDENKMKDGEDYFSWRLGWFKKAREKGGWDVPKWPAKFGGPGWTPTQHYIWEHPIIVSINIFFLISIAFLNN